MKTQKGHENDSKKRARSKRSCGLGPGPVLCRLGSKLKPKKKQLLVSLDCTLETKVLEHSRAGKSVKQGLSSLEHYNNQIKNIRTSEPNSELL